jgi:hypothetical protein
LLYGDHADSLATFCLRVTQAFSRTFDTSDTRVSPYPCRPLSCFLKGSTRQVKTYGRVLGEVMASRGVPEKSDHAAPLLCFARGPSSQALWKFQRASRSSSSRYSIPLTRDQARNGLRKMVSSFLRAEDSTLRLTASDRYASSPYATVTLCHGFGTRRSGTSVWDDGKGSAGMELAAPNQSPPRCRKATGL